jgi:CHAT domain-containing protein
VVLAESCTQALATDASASQPLQTLGNQSVTIAVPVVPGHSYLVEVSEQGNDALAEFLDTQQAMIARADHPERRTGTRRAWVTAGGATLYVRITGKEHAQAAGTASVRMFDLSVLAARPDCQAIFKWLSQADADYAAGQQISRGIASGVAESAREFFDQAAGNYTRAAQALKDPGDAQLRGQTELALASLAYYDLNDWQETLAWSQKAAATLGAADLYRRARAEGLGAAAWLEMGRATASATGAREVDLLVRARGEMRRLVRFHLARGEVYEAALQQLNIGITYLYGGRYQEGIPELTTAARMFDDLGEPQRHSQALELLALCEWGLGRLGEALHGFQAALLESSPQPFPKLYINQLENTALLDYALGHFDESLRLYDIALDLADRVQSPRFQGFALYGLGLDYYALGDSARARHFIEQALELRSAAADRRGRMATLRALATLDAEDGRLEAAIAADEEALSLTEAPSAELQIRVQIAAHRAAAGQTDEARRLLDEVLTDRHAGALIRAQAHLQRGVLRHHLRRLVAAEVDLRIARASLHQLGSVREELTAGLELARTLADAQRPREALTAIDESLQLSEAVRLQSANPELRSGLQAPLRAAYDFKIELLRARYEDARSRGQLSEAQLFARDAFLTADAARAHSLADVAAAEYPPAVRHELAADLLRREDLYRELAARRFALEERLETSGADDPRARHLLGDIAELERQTDAISTHLAQHALIAQSPQAQVARVPVVPADTALVSYWLGAESAYAWVVTAEALNWTRLDAPAEIARVAIDFHRALARIVEEPQRKKRLADARALGDLILTPLGAQLAAAHFWLVIPDGTLDYVPFAALMQKDGFVVQNHDVALTPAAWRLDAQALPVARAEERALLIVADPVYQANDPRLAAIGSALQKPLLQKTPDPLLRDYQRLPFAAREARGVLAQFAPSDTDQLAGLDATRERFLALDLARYRYIHIATHGVFDAQVPELSALLFGSYDAAGRAVDGAVRVADLTLLRLTAEVAVFSACDTALGKEVPSEGLIGISSTVLARGARAVVASLWSVSDEMSADLMTDFYRHLLRDSMSAPEALGAAMRGVLSRNGSSDPALWAAFQVYSVALGPNLPPRMTTSSRLQSWQGREEQP